jgi:NAD(P)-dependent dehydrogenase (short-subunit alcohol dehydrogenase family)
MRNGKVAAVTGSSKGIGRAIAFALAGAGYDVAVHYNTSEKEAFDVAAKIEELGAKTCLIQGDTGDPAVPDKIVKETVEKLGRLDVMVVSAGFTTYENLMDITVENTDRLYQVDFRGFILCARAAARYMVREGVKGSILFNTSVRSFSAHSNDGVYGALKAGLNRIIKSFAIDMGRYGIRVNGFSPGITNVRAPKPEDEKIHPFYKDTHRFVPLRRNGYAEDMGGPVVWLASDAASYVTGQVIRVDGGLSIVGVPESFQHMGDLYEIDD